MRKRFYENTKETVMDFGTFKQFKADVIDKTIRKNAEKRKVLKNA